MSEAKQETKEATPVTKQQIQNLSDLASFNAFCIVKLSNGQQVSTQLTFRHGIPEDKYIEDFKAWYRILDKLAQDGEYVEFWNGAKATPVAPANVSQPDKPANGGTNGDSKKEYPNEFKAGTLSVEYKNKKVYYSVSAPAGAKFPKFPVRVWEEVLEHAGIDSKKVDPIEGFDLTGWIAKYEKNEKGFPGKVIELCQPEFMQDPA